MVSGEGFPSHVSCISNSLLTRSCRYLVIIEVCEAVAIPCPLPIFDLSTKVFPPKDKKTN